MSINIDKFADTTRSLRIEISKALDNDNLWDGCQQLSTLKVRTLQYQRALRIFLLFLFEENTSQPSPQR